MKSAKIKKLAYLQLSFIVPIGPITTVLYCRGPTATMVPRPPQYFMSLL